MALHNDGENKRFRHPDAQEYDLGTISRDDLGRNSAPLGAPEPRGRAQISRGRQVWRTLKILLGLSVLALLGYGIFITSIVAKISTNSWNIGPVAGDSAGRTNVLVLGTGDPGHAGEKLSDTIMVVSFDHQTHRIAQVSVPRDLRVDIPGYGRGKINTANADGGVALAKETLSNTLGIPIDYYVTTNFSGLKEVVDAIGGLTIDVQDRLVDREYPCDDNQYKVCGLEIEPGLQHMSGSQVLKYVRCRKGTCGNDFGRAARQQEVLELLRPQLVDPMLLVQPVKLKRISTALQHGLQTDLGLVQMAQLANRWRNDAKNNPVHLVLSTSAGGYLKGDSYGSSDLLPAEGDFSAISDRVKNIFRTDAASSEGGL